MNQNQLSPKTVGRAWTLSLVGGVVVIGAVAVLLDTIASTAEQIQAGAGQIWTTGKQIANNTVHIPMLVQTNQGVAAILKTSDKLAEATGRIEAAVTGKSQAKS